MMKSRSRSVAEFNEAASLFDAESVRSIIKRVRGTGEIIPFLHDAFVPDQLRDDGRVVQVEEALAYHLNELSQRYRWAERVQMLPAKNEIERRTRKIADLCRQLHEVMVDGDGQVHEGIGRGFLFGFAASDGEQSGAAKVQSIADDIGKLKRWAIQSADRASSQTRGRSRGPKRDHAFHEMLDQLGGLYFQFWGRPPGRTFNEQTGEEGGPYFRFAHAVISRLIPEWVAEGNIEGALGSAIAEHPWHKAVWG